MCDCAASGDSNSASWPSVLSNCVSVGGTTLLWTPGSSTPRTEYTWQSAGCGYATSVLQPAYQKDIGTIQHSYRAIPDVSLIANQNTGVYVVYKGAWYAFGGTSLATPIFAAMLSLANQARFNVGKGPLTTVYSTTPNLANVSGYTPPINNLQVYLYKTIYVSVGKYASDFNDVKIGTDRGSVGGNASNLATYVEGVGYSLPTGLGSPNGSSLCIDLLNV